MSTVEELRSENRSLISRLVERQRSAQFATSGAASLSRQLDSLQSKLDRMTVTRNEPLVLNGSDSITRANINNNNLSDLRWDSRMLGNSEKADNDDIFSITDRSRSPSPAYKLSDLSPPTRDVKSPRAPNNFDRSPRCHMSPSDLMSDQSPRGEHEVLVTLGSPEDSKSVRRKLAEEMSPRNSPHSKEWRAPFSDSTNVNPQTPQRSQEKSLRAGATPKTILKHRKMIDSNVQVDSKFAHTPGWMDRAKHTRLRPKSPGKLRQSARKKEKKKVSTARTLPSFNKTEIDDLKGVSFLDEQFNQSDLPAKFGDPNLLRGELGNMRTTTPNKSPRSQPLVEQGLLDTSVEPQDQQTPSYTRDNLPTPASLSNLGPTPPSSITQSRLRGDSSLTSKQQQRMMGYDWIAALLDQSSTVAERVKGKGDDHEKYFRELREFRRVHKDECQNEAVSLPAGYGHLSLVDTEDISQPPPAPVSPNHTCIHSYSVNPRLYAVPVNSDRNGSSRCAVCNKKKQLPSATSPAFVRVSIPRSTLSSPYKVKPHRRKSFDPSDSVALSKHCLAGWVHQRPMKLPLGRNIDLANETNRLKTKFTMTMAEAEDIAKKSVPVHSRDLDKTTLYNREVRKITDELLDMSHAMQFQSQLLNKTPIH